jgi:signal transduction histidine kinase
VRKRPAAAYPGGVLREGYAGLRRHPAIADWALALVLAFFSTDLGFPAVIVGVLLAATVIARRRFPVGALAAGVALVAVQVGLGLKVTPTDLALVVLLFSVAATRPRPVSLAGLAACVLVIAEPVIRWAQDYRGPLIAVLAGAAALGLAAWVLGDTMASRRAYYAALEDRAARLAAERDAQARIAAAAERARVLEERRAQAVDQSAARLRRIERDLHDGTQVRLTALAMTIGEIKESLESGDGGAESRHHTLALAVTAHRSAKEALTELRDLARGIHPQVLDRGLGPAMTVLAHGSATPADVSVRIRQRPSPAIEAIAYFCAAELLANVTKHGAASRAAVSVRDEDDGGLTLSVTDDGQGGARAVPGGGIAGLVERVQTVDGRLCLSSPPGGPTVVTISLPGHA